MEGRSNIIINVMMGLCTNQYDSWVKIPVVTHEYHSHAEYSVLKSRDTVFRP